MLNKRIQYFKDKSYSSNRKILINIDRKICLFLKYYKQFSVSVIRLYILASLYTTDYIQLIILLFFLLMFIEDSVSLFYFTSSEWKNFELAYQVFPNLDVVF